MPVAKLFTIFALAVCLATSPFSAGSAQKSLGDPAYNAQVKREAAERNAREQQARERKEARKEDERRDKADRQRKDDEREAKKRERDRHEDEERAAKRKRDDEKRAQDKRSDNEAQAKKDTGTSSSPSRSELKPAPSAKRDAPSDDKSPRGSTSPATASRAQHTDFFSIDEIRAMSPEERTRLTTFQPVDLDRHLAGRQRNDVRNYVFTGDANNAPRSGTGASQRDAGGGSQNSQQPTRAAPPTQQVSQPIVPRQTQTPREMFSSQADQDRIASMTIQERAALSNRTTPTLTTSTHANSTAAVTSARPPGDRGLFKETIAGLPKAGSDYAAGLAQGGKSYGTDVAEAVSNPGQSLKGLGTAIRHPIETGKGIAINAHDAASAYANAIRSGDARAAGEIAGRNAPDFFFVEGRLMRNAHLAGKTHPVTGVPFDASGAADFSKYAKATVRFPHTLDRRKDAAAANELAGFQSTPLGYVWHHHPDRQTMHLVPQDIHSKTGHTGSVGLGKD